MCWLFAIVTVMISYADSVLIDDKLDSPFSTDCFKRISIGERLIVYDVTRTSERKTVKECELECLQFHCNFFSFGISASGNGTCELSTRREISRRKDPDYDIYQRTKHCMEGKPTGYEESCYRKFQMGRRLDDRFIRHSLPCDSIQACQHQCSIEPNFECHGFNIRLDEVGIGRGVCELTAMPSSFIDVTRDFLKDPEFDFYEKDLRNTLPNCGYGNEIITVVPKHDQSGNHPNSIYPSTGPKDFWYNSKPVYGDDYYRGRSMGSQNGMRLPGYVIIDEDQRNEPYPQNFQPARGNNFHHQWPSQNRPVHYPNTQVCFQRQYPTMQLQQSTIRSMYELNSVMECEQMCSRASFDCRGYSFRYMRQPSRGTNCYLTDLPSLNPYHDIQPDRDCDIYMRMSNCQNSFTIPSTECFSQVAVDVRMSPTVLRMRISVPTLSECELECLRADFFICRSFIFKTNDHQDNCMLSDRSLKTIDHSSFYRSPGDLLYERGSFGRGCEFDVGPPFKGPTDIGFPRPHNPHWERNTWQHFTVRGWPCRKGTQCALNRDAGFWSCEVEGGDYAQWDYCCRPQHACGYSKGYNYPWCYVGEASPDQWRPCSDHYYPNYNDNYGLNKPNYHGNQPYGAPPYLPSNPHGGSFYPHDNEIFGPPMFWPVSYIYAEPPPNDTTSYFRPILKPFDDAHSSYDDSPRIQFKPSPTQANYPKAFVQKLDDKDKPASDVPKVDETEVNINPRHNFAKKLNSEYVFVSSGSTQNSTPNFLPTPLTHNDIKEESLIQFMNKLNDTLIGRSSSKTKDILEMVEKIILASKTDKPCEERNTTVKDDSSQIKKDEYSKNQDTAMARFLNWSQENYSTAKPKITVT